MQRKLKYHITLNTKCTFYTFFPLLKNGSVLNSRNVHLSHFFLKPIFKNWMYLNFEVIWYMMLSRHQNAGQSDDIQVAKKSFENVVHFKYLEQQ
jgi:hypothetical protein